MKRFVTFVLLFLFSSCLKKYDDFDIETDTELIIPFVSASYKLSDLFYDLKFPYEISNRAFLSIADTLPVHISSCTGEIEYAEIIFNAFNLMPFQVDLHLVPIDSLSNTAIDSLEVTMVDAAIYNPPDDFPTPVQSKNSLIIGAEQLEAFQAANRILLDARFMWPYESVRLDSIQDQVAFDLVVIVDIKLAQ